MSSMSPAQTAAAAAREAPRVLIVVLCHDKKEAVLACLASVTRLEYPACDVVVVDNGSRDGSAAAIRHAHPELCLVESPVNLGAARGRNFGVEQGEARFDFEYVLFLDDDAEVEPPALGVCVEHLRHHPRTGIVCGKTCARPGSNVLMSVGMRVRLARATVYDIGSGETDVGQYEQPRPVDACGGFAFVVRASLFRELGGFDVAFSPYGWEEVDLCLRARRLGYEVAYLPSARFVHKGTRQGRPAVPAYELHKARNFVTLLRRHATWREAVFCAAWVPVRAARVLWKFLRRGEGRLIFAHLRGAVRGLLDRRAG